MVVSEVALGKGRVARGERRGRKMVLASFAFALSPLAWAQIVSDPSAAGGLRPQVVATASGVTQVNIQTPSAAGVSRNVYRQFDVASQGAILNNSRSNVQTQIGGWVQGNSNLASGTARIILNEVNSASPSQLSGYVEVAGKSAEVIIANPAGISVNGGGFINASGVTLTTGTPQLSGGSLDSYRVQGGTITIEGAGLDANNADFANIMARAVQTNAGIWAKDLRVTTGANTINAANTSATVIAGTGATPTVALDVSTLGGMYANKITLVGTEAGLGVNNAGSIVARGGDLVLQSNGVLTNRGLIDAGNTAGSAQTRITATRVNNIGAGAIFGDKLAIEADTLNNQAEIVNGTVYGATIGARTSLNLGVQTLNNTDMGLDTPGNPSLGTSGITSVNIVSLGDILIGGSLNDAGQARGTAESVNNTSATIQAVGNMVIDATEVNNTDAHFASTTQTTTSAVSETIGSAAAGYYVNVNQQTVSSPVVTAALPGVLSAGGDLTIRADTVNNPNSRMLAGGTVTIPEAAVVTNAGVTGTRTTTKTGTAYSLSHDRSCQILVEKGGCVAWGPWYDVWTASSYTSAVPETITVGAGTQSNGASTTAPGMPGATVSNSSLYQISTNPVANYVVVTNPAFTNYKTWMGSDYMLRSVALDPSVTQKRLGDGFYEQRLLNEQIAQLTGRRFLADYTSDDAQYRALMDAGVTYANALKLRPGIALTAAQVARLTSDIVWLQQEEVTLPDGSKVLALVPQVYLSPRSGDLSPSGGLISGASLNIAGGSITNSGTLLGRKLVQINADTINNLGGSIRADDVALTATQDINNTAGTVTAQDQLILQAGRDINSTSTVATARTGNARNGISNTVVDRIAGLYVKGDAGTLLASAGRDINLIASVIQNSGANSQTTLVAQNDINLTTLQTRQTNNLEFDAGNYRRATSTAEAGSSIEGAGTVSLAAGNDVNARAANVIAGKILNVTAANNIILKAGQATNTVDQMASASGKDLFFSSSIQTRRQEQSAAAQVSSLSGQSTLLVANNNLVSIGAKLEATGVDTGTLRVEGENNTALYEVQNSSQTSVTTQTTTGLGVMFNPLGIDLPLEDKAVTNARATSTAIGSKLVSTQKIEISVGNKTELRGAEVEASQIAFVKTDPSKAGELILGGSTNTTQTSHTEKTETAGVYKEMKGNGSTVETLNQTQLKGNVTYDSALTITAQIPDSKGGLALKSQINALASQSGGTGLEYLNQLAANPNVKWDQIALANETWSYDQAGLTPAGAALLSIAVAAYTGGIGSGMLGGTAVTTTTAATLAGSTTFATAVNAGFTALASQAAVAMVNNKGDIGKTLEQMGSEQSIKNLLTTMVTAGALDKLNSTMGWQSVTVKSPFIDQFQRNLGNNLANNMLNSALAAKPFDENTLANSLQTALINTGAAQGANAIGDGLVNKNLNEFTHKLAHAVLGCAGAEAAGGDCKSGAVGAVVGELTAEYGVKSGMNNTDALALAKVLAATSGVMTGGGGDNAAAVNTAATAGANAAENNYLTHAEDLMRQQADAACKKDPASASCAVKAQLDTLDARRDAEIKPLIDACKDSGKAANCEAVAKHYAQTNGFGFASNKYESIGKSGTPFSENGTLVPKNEKTGEEAHYLAPQIKQKDGTYKEDPGGMSYGPFQLSSKTGGLEDFMKYLAKNNSEEANDFLSALNKAGGLEAAKGGKVAFMDTFMELTQKNPQFVEYQFESINQGSNMRFVRKETRVAGLDFDSLPTESKEALFSTSVQHGGGGANKALDQAFSSKLNDPAEDNFAIKQMQYNDAVKDGKALITQLDQLKDQKIKLLESTQGANGEALKRIDRQISSVNQKIEAQNAKVQANDTFIKNTQAAMQDAGFKASADPEEFIKDIYKWRIKSNPSEAKTRYIPERDMLLRQLKDRLEQEKATKSK